MKLEETISYKLYNYLDHNLTKYSKDIILFEDFIQTFYDLIASSENWSQLVKDSSEQLHIYFESNVSRFLGDVKTFLAVHGQKDLVGETHYEDCETESQQSEGTERSQVISNITDSSISPITNQAKTEDELNDQRTDTIYDYFIDETDSDDEMIIEKNYRRNRENKMDDQVIENASLGQQIENQVSIGKSHFKSSLSEKILTPESYVGQSLLDPQNHVSSFPIAYYPYFYYNHWFANGRNLPQMKEGSQVGQISQSVSIPKLQSVSIPDKIDETIDAKKVKFVFVSSSHQEAQSAVSIQIESQSKPQEKIEKNTMQISKTSNLVYVKKISQEYKSVCALRKLFSKFGTIVDIKLDPCQRSASIEFLKEADAVKAIHNYQNSISDTQMLITKNPPVASSKAVSNSKFKRMAPSHTSLRSNESITEKLQFLYNLKKFVVDKDKKRSLALRIKGIKDAQRTNFVTESTQEILASEIFNLDFDMTLILSNSDEQTMTTKVLTSQLQNHGRIETLKINPTLKLAEVKYYDVESTIQAMNSSEPFSMKFKHAQSEELMQKIRLFEEKYL